MVAIFTFSSECTVNRLVVLQFACHSARMVTCGMQWLWLSSYLPRDGNVLTCALFRNDAFFFYKS